MRMLALAAIAAATTAAAYVSSPRASAASGGGQVSAGVGIAVGALVSLGPISILDGAVTVSGTVDANAALGAAAKVDAPNIGATVSAATHAAVSAQATVSAAANVSLTVNNQPVAVNDQGGFTATVAVGAQAAVKVKATSQITGEVFVTTIPVAAIPEGGNPVDALATLDAAGVTLLLPPDGLTCFDGLPALVTLNVQDAKLLAALEINGANLLGGATGNSSTSSTTTTTAASKTTKPNAPRKNTPTAHAKGGTRSASSGLVFTHEVASSSHSVEIAVEDEHGVAQTSTFPLRQVTSVIRIGRTSSVSAAGARGIRVSTVHFDTTTALGQHRVRMQVTLRDRRNYLVRDAVVMVKGLAHRISISGQSAAITNARGTATLVIPVTTRLLGKRIYVEVIARTPVASAYVKVSTLLPGSFAA